MQRPEPWLRGPLEGVDPYLMPAAHALMHAGEDLARVAAEVPAHALWTRPGGAASAGFHLRHIAGSVDRLLAYARGEALSEAQRAAAKAEETDGAPGDGPALLAEAQQAIARALAQIRGTARETLLDPRGVGRAGLPSTVLGLLFHVAEHTQRHTGQLIATARAVRDVR
jgi:uncharacterized damage-inducible protein DinB